MLCLASLSSAAVLGEVSKASPAEQIKQAEQDMQTTTTMGQRQLSRSKRLAKAAEKSLENTVSSTATSVERQIKKVENEMGLFSSQSVSDSERIGDQAREVGTMMSDQQELVTELDAEITELVKDRQEEVDEEMRSMLEQTQESFEEQFTGRGGFMEQIDSTNEGATTELEKVQDEFTEEYSGLGEKISEAGLADKEKIEELKDTSGEVVAEEKMLGKAVDRLGRTGTKEASRVAKDADKAARVISAQAAKEVRKAEKELNGVVKSSAKALKQATRDARSEADAVKNMNADKASEMSGQIKDITKDVMSQIRDSKAQSDATMADARGAFMSAEGDFQSASDEASALKEEAKEVDSDAREKLGEEIDEEQEKMVEVGGQIESSAEEAKEKLSSDLETMGDDVTGNLEQQQAKVEEDVEKKVAGVQEKLETGTASVEKAFAGIHQESASLQGQVKDEADELTELGSKLGEGVKNLHTAADAVKTGIAETKVATINSLDQLKAKVQPRIDDMEAKLQGEVWRAGNETSTLVDSVRRDLTNKINSMKTDATSQLSRTSRMVGQAEDRGRDVLDGMTQTVESITSLKDQIESKRDSAKATVDEALEAMKGQIGNAETALKNTKASVMTVIASEDADMQENAAAELRKTKGETFQRISESARQNLGVMESLRTSVQDLQLQSEEDYQSTVSAQAAARRQLSTAYKTLRESTAKSEQSANELQARVAYLDSAADAGVKKQQQETEMMTKQALAKYQQEGQKQQDSAELAMKQAKETGEKEIKAFKADADTDILKSTEGLDSFVSENEGQLKSLDEEVKGMGSEVSQLTAQARSESEASEQKLTGMRSQLDGLNNQVAKTESESHEVLAAEEKSVLSRMGTMTANAKASAEAEITGVSRAAKQQLNEMTVRTELAEAKERAASAAETNSVKQSMSEIDGDMERTKEKVNDLQSTEQSVTKALNEDVMSLQNAEDLGQVVVGKTLNEAESRTQSATSDQLDAMDLVAGQFKVVKKKEQEDIAALNKEFTQKLDEKQRKNAAEFAALSDTVASVEKATPNTAKLYEEDTKDAKKEMADADKRIGEAKDFVQKVFAGSYESIRDMRARREKQAAAIHETISATKRHVVDQVGKAAEELAAVKNEVRGEVGGLQKDLDGFKESMANMEGITVNHDQDEMNEMNAKMLQLQRSHSSMMVWEKNFKGHTMAWRAEVERQLRSLGRGLSEEDSFLAKSKLEQELAMNNALGELQKRVQGEVARASSDEAKNFGATADSMNRAMQEVFGEEKENEAKKQTLAESVKQMLLRNGEQSQKELAAIGSNQQALQQRADNLKKETDVTIEELNNILTLPRATASDYNRETDARYSDLRSKLNGALGGSLLERGASLRVEPSALVEEGETAEEAALHELNDELYKQNVKLMHQNAELETGLRYAKSVPV